ncbi:MAG: imidazoleglycerol-phosphate dehydratase HisB [Candidatus Bathyarchaeota archaeon]|jgi:imidazoleglycerol-phosphate dehydratase|nr:imidazoleglycerol-phosphate dehydratase HisB [Candidatus Bathyarchaeota archaeon]
MRRQEFRRETSETIVSVGLNLDGIGEGKIETPLAFFNHMLGSLATHSLIDLRVEAHGDLCHHIVEDVGIGVGSAIKEALGDGKGIARFGYALVPMDCSIASCALDIGGRPYAVVDLCFKGAKVEDTASEDLTHFFETLATSMCANIHLKVDYGRNDHHKAEAAFKAFALSLRQAVSVDLRRKGVPSSKGVI